MSQRAKRKIKPPQYLDEYELGTNICVEHNLEWISPKNATESNL